MKSKKSKDTLPLSFTVESNYGYSEIYGAARYNNFPVRVSIPLAPKTCAVDEILELRDEKGKVVSSSIRPMARWPDGSVRIWELWFPTGHLNRRESRRYELHRAKAATRATTQSLFLDQPSKFTLSVCLGDGTRVQSEIRLNPIKADSNQAVSCFEDEKEISLEKNPGSTLFKGALARKTYTVGIPALSCRCA